ncbi:MAG: tetratricopeptide repeat protein [Oceanococcaceae bacterium]
MRFPLLRLLALLLALGLPLHGLAAEGRKPPTKVTEKLSQAVYEQMQAAQQAMEADDLDAAEAALQKLLDRVDKLNDYEQAQLHNFLAAVHYEQGRVEDTIADYVALLRIEAAPEQLRSNALFRLAQLFFVQEDYARSVQLLDRWMQSVDSVRPEAYMLKAQALYQLERYAEAEGPILQALKEARQRGQPFAEGWLSLLRAVYYELGDYPKAIKVLDQMLQRWPKPAYYKQIAGMLGLIEQQKAQLSLMRAANSSQMLDSEFELLNLARLYMAEDAPYPAIALLQEAMQSGALEESADNLQLLAQAMALARDSAGQIPVLARAASMARDADLYVYLGQAQLSLYRWADAADSLQKALDIGGLDRRGSVYMQLGTAWFNLKRYSRASQAFREATAFADQASAARQWVNYVNQEVARHKAMQGEG